MTPAELERLNTWAIEIIEAVVEGIKWRQEGDERRALNCGGLTINLRKGCWFSHTAGHGGVSVLPLIRLLKSCSQAEAKAWGTAWLRSHPGTGSCAGADDEPEIDNAAVAQEVIAKLGFPMGTAAVAYLDWRGLNRAPPPSVMFLPNARIGEGALVGLLTSHGRTTGVQLTYLEPGGRRSTVRPARRRFNLEKAADAVFEIQATPQGEPGLEIDTLITEGLEDGLSLREVDLPARIIALPGIGALTHVPVRKGERIVVVRDGDPEGSPADKALTAGIDHLLLEGASVEITNTPPGEDANSILQQHGGEALAELVTDTYPAELSIDGEFIRLSRLDPVDYDRERKPMADRLGIRLPTLDHEVGRRRSATPGSAAPSAAAEEDVDEIELLDEPVELQQVLDDILVELQRYIVAEETLLAAVALWCAHTHLCHHEHIRLQRSPRLAIQARTPGAGKTTLLEAIGALVPRQRVAASLTASTVLRVVDQLHPTLLIDEADRVLHDQNNDLLSILNAGDRRATAWVERSVPTPDGDWAVKRFSVWGAVAFAGIDELPPTQQDRSIVVQMQKAIDRDIPDHLEDGNSAELVLLKRKLATWAHDLEEFPRPLMPDVLTRQAGRIGDNWRVLFSIAQLAGGRWPRLVEQAALEAVKREGSLTVVQRLLESVHRLFGKRADDQSIKADDKTRVTTPDLIAALLADDEEEWGTANRGRAVTSYWLRDNLRHLLNPPGTLRWEDPAVDGRRGRQYRGYLKVQFEKAWERHLPASSSAYPSEPSDVSGVSEEHVENTENYPEEKPSGSNSSGGTRAGDPPDQSHPEENPSGSNSTKSKASPDPPDTADSLDGYGEQQTKPAPNGAVRWNGQAEPNGVDEPEDLDDAIRAYAVTNPKKSIASIAKYFGQPKAVVAELLGCDR